MNKTVVISGANRGIGLALTGEFVRAGDHVIAGVRNVNDAQALKQISGKGSCKIVSLDVTQDASVKKLASELGAVDILVNNAGVLSEYGSSLEEASLSEIERMHQVNVMGAVRLTQALLPKLKKGKHAIIANISSLVGSIADNNTSGRAYGYRLSKAAMNMFTKTLSVDYPDMIAVSLHPGWVQTDMGGSNAPVAPAESASGLFHIIARLEAQDRGRFLDYTGKPLPW